LFRSKSDIDVLSTKAYERIEGELRVALR